MSDAHRTQDHSHDGMSMTCRELFERLSEYVDGELSQEICQEIRKHLDACDPCVNFAKTLQATANLCRRLPTQPIPPAVAADLRRFLSDYLPRPK